MSQMLSQIPGLRQVQEQRLTAQLIQAMEILALNAQELESRLEQELDSNPALEIVTPEDEFAEPPAEPADAPSDRTPEEQALVVTEGGDPKDFERLENLVREYDWIDDDGGYTGRKSPGRLSEESDNKLEAIANTAARPASLREHLLAQWSLLDLDETTRRIGARIIDELDDAGRLNTPLEQIGATLDPRPTPQQLEAALARVQELDPPGVGARSLKECLLLQLEALPGDTELAQLVVERHLDDLEKNRLPAIAAALNVELADVKEALGVIGRLALKPGLDVVSNQAPAVVPDVVVEFNEQENRYDVRLTRPNYRELRISPEFREQLERSRDDKQARQFIRQKLEAATALIDAVRFRRERLLQVAREVVEAQREFLDLGEQHLRVLLMKDIAAKLGCDESTISRTVGDKYIQTPRGIFPLRRFFMGGAETRDGAAIGWDSIKAKVEEIVKAEDKSNPLSDDEIVDKLQAAGIDIKRRTVAKYRAQLGIPTRRQRRRY